MERPAVRRGLRPPESLTHRREARGFASSPCGRRCTRAGHRAQLPARDGRPRLTVTAPSPWVRARQGAPGRILRKSGDGGDSGVSRGPPPAETLPGAVRQSRHASASRSREACSRSAPDPGMGATRRQLRPGHSRVPHGRRSHRGTWPSRNHRPSGRPAVRRARSGRGRRLRDAGPRLRRFKRVSAQRRRHDCSSIDRRSRQLVSAPQAATNSQAPHLGEPLRHGVMVPAFASPKRLVAPGSPHAGDKSALLAEIRRRSGNAL